METTTPPDDYASVQLLYLYTETGKELINVFNNNKDYESKKAITNSYFIPVFLLL